MQAKRIRIALAAIAFSTALPAVAQTTLTMPATSMSRSPNVVVEGNLLKLAPADTPGSAWQNFGGASGKYNVQVYVVPETDGRPTLEVYNGATLLRRYSYPLGNNWSTVSFSINDVTLATGQPIKLTGYANEGAHARVEKVVFTKVADSTATSTAAPATTAPAATTPAATSTSTTSTSTASTSATSTSATSTSTASTSATSTSATSTLTMQAVSMSRSPSVVVEGNLLKLATLTPGSAWQSFSGTPGKYKMQVFVVPESDGKPTLEVYNGATLLTRYTYPLGNNWSPVSFTINDVTVATGQTIKLTGYAHEGAHARVEKVVFTKVADSTAATSSTAAPATTAPATTTPATSTTASVTAPATSTPTTSTAATSTATNTTGIGASLGSAVQTAVAAQTTLTMPATSMSRSPNVVVEGNLLKLAPADTPGSAWQSFSGASGQYRIQVYVVPETDGRPTLEVFNGAALLQRYTYPLGNNWSPVSFTINDVTIATGQTIKVTGYANEGAHARIEKLVFTRVAGSTGTSTPPPSTSTPPPSTSTPPSSTTPPVLTLPSTNTSAVATFHSLGLYWRPPSNPGSAGCKVQYRVSGESTWKDGLPMWYDARDGQCRGSLVYLTPGTDYQVQFSLPGQQPSAQLAAKTWSENFPIARTVYLTNGTTNQPLSITEGGTAGGYVLYTSPPGGQTTIDVGENHAHAITISAPYVIVRGLVVKGGREGAIRMLPGTRDLVIEGNDISEWGAYERTNDEGWKIGVEFQGGIVARCDMEPRTPWLVRSVIQRNRIHHPRYGSSSWREGHPMGPNAILYANCGGNHVFRYNDIYSEWGRYFNDAIGGGENFSDLGMPTADSDIYGNRISEVWDDAIEAEGGNRNVRIFGNYFDNVFVGVATTATHFGPVYIFRNVKNRSRMLSQGSLDNDQGGTFNKPGQAGGFGGGRRYVFHNTALQPTEPGLTYPVGSSMGIGSAGSPVTNTVSRNNIWHIKKPWWSAIDVEGGYDNDFNNDLFNGNISAQSGSQTTGIVGTPVYQAGHGAVSAAGGFYQLAPESPGYDRGVRLPNFNDDFIGAAPDIGAAEAGKPAMRFGVTAGQ